MANTASADDIWGGLGGLGDIDEIGIASHSPAVRGASRGFKRAKAREFKLEGERSASMSMEEEADSSVESESTKIEDLMDGSEHGSDGDLTKGGYKVDEIVRWDQLPWRKVTDVVEASDAALTTCESRPLARRPALH